MAGLQLDLFGQVEAAEQAVTVRAAAAASLAEWRALLRLDCCTGQPIPPVAYGYGGGPILLVRCGRCGETTPEYGMAINHDLGWVDCPTPGGAYRDRRRFVDADDLSAGRHDALHHPACARPGCGHAWGIHTRGWGVAPPEDAHCYGWCGCPGYLAPEPA